MTARSNLIVYLHASQHIKLRIKGYIHSWCYTDHILKYILIVFLYNVWEKAFISTTCVCACLHIKNTYLSSYPNYKMQIENT